MAGTFSVSIDRRTRLRTRTLLLLVFLSSISSISAQQHMKREPLHWVNERASGVPLVVTNNCAEDIYPAIQTQSGSGPPFTGFFLGPGDSSPQTVSADWVGRVWARTNCSFNDAGTAPANGQPGSACTTGDCGGTVICQGSGQPPATLAEFSLTTTSGQTFYDLSLVDGYNLPVGIISLLGKSDNSTLTDIPPNLTNPVCIGTAALLAAQGSTADALFGTNSTYPLPLDQSVSTAFVQGWCPWDCQLSPPQKPGDGIYPYPDDHIQRPLFNPCLSYCAKYNTEQYCCTGKYASASACTPSYYSTQAKQVCPDAYSYAFDDQTSTFIVPSGGGFEVVYCPAGRSTTILATFESQLQQLAQAGHVTRSIIADAMNDTLINSHPSSAPGLIHESRALWATVTALLVAAVLLCGL